MRPNASERPRSSASADDAPQVDRGTRSRAEPAEWRAEVRGARRQPAPTRYRVTCGDHVLVIDKPRNWREQRVVLQSIAHWRFVLDHAHVHNLPALLDIATTDGIIVAFELEDVATIGVPS